MSNYSKLERQFLGEDVCAQQDRTKPKITPSTDKMPYALQAFEVDDFVNFGRDELGADLDRIRRDFRIT